MHCELTEELLPPALDAFQNLRCKGREGWECSTRHLSVSEACGKQLTGNVTSHPLPFFFRAQPGVLGSAEVFKEEFVHPIELGQKQNATKRELAEARQSKTNNTQCRVRPTIHSAE